MTSLHVTLVMLYFSVAGTCKENIVPKLVVVRSCESSSVNSDLLTIQSTMPVVALQLKVAVDPRVALTDVGVLVKPGLDINSQHTMYT